MMVSSRFGLLSLLVWMGNLPYYPLGITLEASGWLTQGTSNRISSVQRIDRIQQVVASFSVLFIVIIVSELY